MHSLIGIAGVLAVGAFTPGPNNLVVMREAARAGWRVAAPAIVGVVSGSLALLALIFAGAGRVFAEQPRLAMAIAWAGCLYLSWLGARLVIGSFRPGSHSDQEALRGLPVGLGGLFVFQFLNPKAWVLILTVVSSAQSTLGVAILPTLALLQVVIFTSSLLVWSFFGVLLMKYMQRPAWRSWFDRVMGTLLIASALVLLLST